MDFVSTMTLGEVRDYCVGRMYEPCNDCPMFDEEEMSCAFSNVPAQWIFSDDIGPYRKPDDVED